MTESAARKPFFTRRRVVAGAIAVVVIGVVAGVLGLFDQDSTASVRLTITRLDGEDTSRPARALVTVSNLSATTSHLISFGRPGLVDQLRHPGFPTNALDWTPKHSRRALEYEFLSPQKSGQAYVDLPDDGRVGSVPVGCLTQVRRLPAILDKVRQLWWRIRGYREEFVWIICDQEIQCPKPLPDGTVEPPRLLSKPEGKR